MSPEPPARPPASPSPEEDARDAAVEALARARRAARARGLRPGARGRGRGGDRAGGGLTEQRSPTPAGPRDPQPLGGEVDRLVTGRGWDADVQIGAVVGRWPTIVGRGVAEHVVPVAFEGAVLTVRADSTAWATQMRLLVSSVLTRIETEVGEGVVTEIVVHGPGGPSWRKGPLSSGGRGPRDTYG